jgi:hypothetical protein
MSLFSPPVWAQGAPSPVFAEDFSGGVDRPLTDRWVATGGLDAAQAPFRIGTVFDPGLNRQVGRFTVQLGDAPAGIDGRKINSTSDPSLTRQVGSFAVQHDDEMAELDSRDLYVCSSEGSRVHELERDLNTVAPSERVEVEVRHNRDTGEGELVHFDETVWYRFAFKIAGDWPSDRPTGGRPACRTVLHQIKQDSFKDGKTCSASPFFKIEARPWGDGVKFFAQISYGAACAVPPDVHRVQICAVELPKEKWTTVNVRLFPSHDRARVDIWLNGRHCGLYEGPMADPRNGATRGDKPFINAQPRFGIYRDRRPETQTIYFDRILFWNRDPGRHPGWAAN